MIRSSLLAFASLGFLWLAHPSNAQSAETSALPLLRFDTPGHQSADVMPVEYHRHHHHRHYHHH